jgi:hypothetical protein
LRETSIQVLDEESKAYFNFINSLNSESTRNSYKFCLQKFLIYYKLDLGSYLKLPTEEMSSLIIKYLVAKKILLSIGNKKLKLNDSFEITLMKTCETRLLVSMFLVFKIFAFSR